MQTVYSLNIGMYSTVMWVWWYSFPSRICRKEETQMEVQIATCLDVLAFEMNSGRILAQISSIQVFKGFLGFVDPRESPSHYSWAASLPASLSVVHTRCCRWLHKHCAMFFPTTSVLPSSCTASFPKSDPGGHTLSGEVQSSSSLLWTYQSQRQKASNLKSKRKAFSWNMAALITTI